MALALKDRATREPTELAGLVERARARDIPAFTELTRRFRNMAFAYAFSMLGDFHLAEDAAQEAFIAVWRDLGNLREPLAFPGWLRSIVRHQCCRILRKRDRGIVSLGTTEPASEMPWRPDYRLEQQELHDGVIRAVETLPQPLREVTALFYIQEYSQKEIASFLDVPVSTVNNRLHAARTRLKRRLLSMIQDTLHQNALPEEFASRIGEIVQVEGSVIQAHFNPGDLPDAFTELAITDSGLQIHVEVVRRLDNGDVLCVAETPDRRLRPGLKVTATGGRSLPVSHEAIERAIAFLGGRRDEGAGTPRLLETGVKVIDLLCPCAAGGTVGIFGPCGVGTLVLMAELAHRFREQEGALTVFKFLPVEDAGTIQEFRAEDPDLREMLTTSAVRSFYLLSDRATDREYARNLTLFDTVIYCSPELGRRHIWPAVDWSVSSSRLLVPAIVGQEHYETAMRVREILQRDRQIRETQDDPINLSANDITVVPRAVRVQQFLAQPFYVAEPYTKKPAEHVGLQETIQSFRKILDGKYDDLPEEAFRFRGTRPLTKPAADIPTRRVPVNQ